MEDRTLIFDCFGRSGFGDQRGEPYAGGEDAAVNVGVDTPEQIRATLLKARETLAKREAAAAETRGKVDRVLAGDFGQLEPEPEPEPTAEEGVPPS
eukprot:COSAG02_NODE_457_length_21950_cov_35.452794_3_plen_96_part_00